MKFLIIASAALAFAVPAAAQTDMPINPDGIDIHGHNPDGQAFTPPGFNTAIPGSVYAPMAAAPAGMIGGSYPPCTAQNTDRCEQTYVKGGRSMGKKAMKRRGRR